MHSTIRNAMMMLALAAWLVADCGTARGEKGGGGGRGHGGGGRGGRSAGGEHARGGKPTNHHVQRGGRDSHHPKHVAEHKEPKGARPIASDRSVRDASHPWSKQRANEQRKLDHRLGIADKLERKADANGNEHLRDTAERMRQKAHDHYAKRLEKIDSKQLKSGEGDDLPDELPDDLPGELPDDVPDGRQPLSEFANSRQDAPLGSQKLTGQQNALSRQLRNEQRKLEHQTELAERLRTIAEEQGDPALLQAADRIEQRALDRFENRMEAIRSFQQRHGLTAVKSQ